MSGWGRGKIAAIGFAILVVILFAVFAVEALASLCRLSENATCSSAPPTVALLLLPLTVLAGYAITVWRAQLTPVLLAAILLHKLIEAPGMAIGKTIAKRARDQAR